MRYISLNVKGLTDPQKANLVKQWIKTKGHLEIITLVEVKTKGEELKRRLHTVSQDHMWVHTFHPQGSGGLAVGIHTDSLKDMEDFHIDLHNQWISVSMTKYTYVGLYAHGPQKLRTRTWNSLHRLQAPIILMGDFNMVESL